MAQTLFDPVEVTIQSPSIVFRAGDGTKQGGFSSHGLTWQLHRDDFPSNPPFGDAGSFVNLRRHITTAAFGGQDVANFYVQAHGTLGNGAFSFGVANLVGDDSFVANTVPVVTGCANNGSGLIRVTCTGHGFATGDQIAVYGVTGTVEANGAWIATVIDVNTFDLQGSAFTNAYVSGGNATNRPGLYGFYSAVKPHQPRGGLTGTAAHGDDICGYGAENQSTNNSTAGSAFLVNTNAASFTGDQWHSGFQIEAQTKNGLVFVGNVSAYGIDFRAGGTTPAIPLYTSGLIRFTNNDGVWARNAADSTDVALFRFNASNEFELQTVVRHSGTKWGAFNATPIVQPSAVGTATGYSAGATAATFHSDDKYTGNVGATAYTINGIVAALKNLGWLAA